MTLLIIQCQRYSYQKTLNILEHKSHALRQMCTDKRSIVRQYYCIRNDHYIKQRRNSKPVAKAVHICYMLCIFSLKIQFFASLTQKVSNLSTKLKVILMEQILYECSKFGMDFIVKMLLEDDQFRVNITKTLIVL